MKITEVETFVLHVPIGKHIEDSFNKVDTWGLPGVIIRTDEGIEGLGYTSTLTNGDDDIVSIIHKHYTQLIPGRDPNCHRQIWEAFFWSPRRLPSPRDPGCVYRIQSPEVRPVPSHVSMRDD